MTALKDCLVLAVQGLKCWQPSPPAVDHMAHCMQCALQDLHRWMMMSV